MRGSSLLQGGGDNGCSFEGRDSLFQRHKRGAKKSELCLQAGKRIRRLNFESRVSVQGISGCGHGAAKQMGVPGLAGSGLPGKDDGEGACRSRCRCGFGTGSFRSRGETVKCGGDGGEVVEGVEAVGAGPEFTGCLRAAEKQQTDNCGLVAAEVEHSPCAVLVFWDSGVARGGDEAEVLEGVEGLTDVFFREFEDRIAGGALICGGLKGI